jgi:hypothetical protein
MMKIDINLEMARYKTDADALGPRRRYGRNLVGLLAALAAGVAFGLVLAVCFLGVASVAILDSSSSVVKLSATCEDESIRAVQDVASRQKSLIGCSPTGEQP